MVEEASVFLMRASPSNGMRARGFRMRVRPIEARGRGRSLSDKKRAMSVRFASRDSRTIQRIGRDAGNCGSQTERGAFSARSLGDKLPRILRRGSKTAGVKWLFGFEQNHGKCDRLFDNGIHPASDAALGKTCLDKMLQNAIRR